MHAQLTALLAASEQSGGLSAAQAAAELAGVEVGGGGAVQLQAQQAALAEARCRERWQSRPSQRPSPRPLPRRPPPARARWRAPGPRAPAGQMPPPGHEAG
jgi:hypothetical protein